ncbi:S41 family peptidase [Nevskia soli]|uniref:S41 family peptidase n=1 Tax=Nevskia soli TaxID=418856 RepID=UPI0004A6FCA0|nr:S41 family peptidase [Nevskia soli]
MSVSRRIVLALACGAVIGASFPLARRAVGGSGPVEPLPLGELRSFTQAIDIIGKRYVEPVSPDKLMENALRGMVDGLEPHSRYLDKKEFADWNVNTSGKYAGIGIEVEMRNGFLRVVSAMDHTPAAAAGIQSGDIITLIDGQPTTGLKLKEAVDRMRGTKGTRIKLGVLHVGAATTSVLELTREVVKVASVRSKMLEPGIGYLRITNFSADTGDAFTDELNKLQQQAGGDLHGLILDLRNNPGGVVTSAVKVSDAFLERGQIVLQRGRAPGANHEYDASSGDLLKGRPLVAMVNGGTASAAEIVAGALQDQRRAVVVGSTTFGKGLVQSVSPLNEGGAVILTIARYYTPSGRSIQAEGIKPDIVIEPVKVEPVNAPIARVREADLKGSLVNEKPAAKPAPTVDAPDASGDTQAGKADNLAVSDFVLYNSLNLLKGLITAGTAHAG